MYSIEFSISRNTTESPLIIKYEDMHFPFFLFFYPFLNVTVEMNFLFFKQETVCWPIGLINNGLAAFIE